MPQRFLWNRLQISENPYRLVFYDELLHQFTFSNLRSVDVMVDPVHRQEESRLHVVDQSECLDCGTSTLEGGPFFVCSRETAIHKFPRLTTCKCMCLSVLSCLILGQLSLPHSIAAAGRLLTRCCTFSKD
ncbi:uncharacterized protein LOC124336821 isoform X1 [Daphnia pulicaria]|uniref:uncharacterized protein LOC124336821 isoform X1 n=1 Tax=Daphnia pulicaria TaxID=35523 RepID=UPI001EEADDC3|nr:uncharacterized protein LOC124336821 isoform X1 [Daphnia pulicaria]